MINCLRAVNPPVHATQVAIHHAQTAGHLHPWGASGIGGADSLPDEDVVVGVDADDHVALAGWDVLETALHLEM